MLTPIEKVVFSKYNLTMIYLDLLLVLPSGYRTVWLTMRCLDTILILFISMLITAAYIYLPDHVLSLYRHINYYWAGQPVADQIALHAANMKLSAATATAAATTAEALKEL